MQSPRKRPWFRWPSLVLSCLATALTWPLTTELPFVNRVAIAVAVALGLYAVAHFTSHPTAADSRVLARCRGNRDEGKHRL